MLLHDSAYDGLSYRLRRELHARAGDTIRSTAKRGEEQPELLSFHYLHAQRYPEAWSYSLSAAERARAVYANIEAAEFYERALLAGRRLAAADQNRACPTSTRLSATRGTALAPTSRRRLPIGPPGALSMTTPWPKPVSRSSSPESRPGSTDTRVCCVGSPRA